MSVSPNRAHRTARPVLGLIAAGFLCIAVLTPSPAQSYGRDVHFTTVYAILRLSGIGEADALRIASAAESVDENAETSPLPEPGSGRSLWWGAQGARWHAMAPNTKWFEEWFARDPDAAKHFVLRRMLELRDRAFNELDRERAKVYFGQYLHYLADVVSHDSYYSLFGHLKDMHTPDVPGLAQKGITERTVHWLIESVQRFQARRLDTVPKSISSEVTNTIVHSLEYASPSDKPNEQLEELARHPMEISLRRVDSRFAIPAWRPDYAIPFTVDGELRSGPIVPPGQAATHLGESWEAAAQPASRFARSLATMGLEGSELGGVDLSNVQLAYVTDESYRGGERLFSLGTVADKSGKGGDAALAVSAFASALALPDSIWWVNLHPAQPDRIIDPLLGAGDAGRVMLEADLLLKRIVWESLQPDTASGKAYWREYFQLSLQQMVGATAWRIWITPGRCDVLVVGRTVELGACAMDVNINLENISLAVASSSSEGLKARSDLVRITESHIAPAVRRIVNEDPRFAMLRTVHRSRALAQAYRELQKERVALASLEESLNLKMLPAPTLRDPKTIWQQYVGELKAAKFTTSVPFTGGVFELRSGGVVLDAVRFATVSESEAFARPSPYAPGRGLLIATAHGSRPASLERIAIAKALDGYRAMKPGDRAAVAAAELLPALALLRHADYAAVRREVAVDPASAIYLAIADGIRDGSREHEGNGALAGLDSLSFAIWSRVDPRSAARAAIETTSLPRLLSYLLAVTAYPRTGDLSPQVALEAAMRFASDSPEAQAKYLARLAQISAVVAPAAATVIVDRLTDQAHAGAMIDALPEVLEAVEALAKLNEKEAVRLFSVFLGVLRNEGYDPQLPEIKRVNETLNDLIAWKGRSGKSSDLRDQARYVRALWLERPADALPAADELSRAIRQRKSSDATEQAFMDVLPILARRDPQLAMELADGLHEPLARMVVFSQLAAHAANPTAANIRLAQSIALELEAWVKSRR